MPMVSYGNSVPFALLGALFGLVFSMTVQNVHAISYSGGKGWQIISTLPLIL